MELTLSYERDLSGAYLLIPAQPESEVTVGYGRRMILENQIRGFVPLQKKRICGESSEEGLPEEMYEYSISSLVSLREYLEHYPLTLVFFKQLIFSVCQAAEELGEYLLTEEFLYLTPETVFLRIGETAPFEGSVLFCLYPDMRRELKPSLSQLLKYLMEKTDTAEDSCAVLCYELYGLVQKENFYLKEFMEVLENHGRAAAQQEPEKKKRPKQPFAGRRNGGIMDTKAKKRRIPLMGKRS